MASRREALTSGDHLNAMEKSLVKAMDLIPDPLDPSLEEWLDDRAVALIADLTDFRTALMAHRNT